MEIAIIKDGQITEIGHYKNLFPNTSFPTTGPSPEFMEENSVLGVTVWKQYDNKTQKLVSSEPYIEDNQVFTVTVAEKSADEIAADTAAAALSVRFQRDQLLKDTDWTQVEDSPVDKQAFAAYRQALRDITTQATFPFEVQWPVKPE